MRKTRKKPFFFISVFLVSLLISAFLPGCGATDSFNNTAAMDTAAYEVRGGGLEEGQATAEAAAGTGEAWDEGSMDSDNQTLEAIQLSRKIIKNYQYDMETLEFDDFLSSVKERVALYDGYIQSLSQSGSSYSEIYSDRPRYRYASLVIRIPQEKSEVFIKDLTTLGNVLYQNESAEDVTLQYTDTDTKVKMLQLEEERLLDLLSKAEDLDSIIKLESRLTDVRHQIEMNTSVLREYDNLVDYTTISLNVNEVRQITPPQSKDLLQTLKSGFFSTLDDIGLFFQNLFVFVVVNSPYLVFIALAAVIFTLAFKKIGKNRKKKQSVSSNSEEFEEKPKE